MLISLRLLQLCDTYPRHLYVPASATTPVLLGSAKFRSKARLPVLSYMHRENQVDIISFIHVHTYATASFVKFSTVH